MKFSKEQIRQAILLYGITDRTWLKPGEKLCDICREILEHGVTFLQLREKELDQEACLKEAKELKELCTQFGVPFVVNDSAEIAVQAGADGVHVGQSDIKGRNIRAMIGPDRILGISAGTVEEARKAEQAGADYIGVGAVFGTSTKKDARNLSVEKLREIASAVSIPVVAIGGINCGNVRELTGSGVDGIAVISALFGAKRPGEAAAELAAAAKEIADCE